MGEVLVVVLVGAAFVALILWGVRYKGWPLDPSDESEPQEDGLVEQHWSMSAPHLPGPAPVAGWEWQNLTARDSLSLIAPDSEHTYSVRINDDSSFSVRMDP